MEEESVFSLIEQRLQAKSSSPLYAKAILIINLIKDTLQSSGEISKDSQATAIFLSLFSLLKNNNQKTNTDNNDATLLLLNIVIPKLSIPVLRTKTQELIKAVVEAHSLSLKSAIVGKYTIGILTEILQIILPADWDTPQIKSVIKLFFESIIEEKAQVRKQATRGLSLLLEQRKDVNRRLSQEVFEFVKTHLLEGGRPALLVTYFLNMGLKSFSADTLGNTVYLLSNLLNSSLEEELTIHIYLCIENLMAVKPVSVDVSEKLIKEFLQNQPDLNSEDKLVFSYCQCLVQTLLHINTFEPKTARNYISSCLSFCTEMMLVEKETFPAFAQKSMELLIIHTINPLLWKKNNFFELMDLADMEIEAGPSGGAPDNFAKVASIVGHLLSSRYDKLQKYTMKVISVFFEKLESDALNNVKSIIQELVDTRLKRPRNEFEKCFGKIVNSMGPMKILELYPINLNEDPLDEAFEEKTNSWLLPVLNNCLKSENLKLFLSYFYPSIVSISQQVSKEKSIANKRIYEYLLSQLWGLFPSCHLLTNARDELQSLTHLFAHIETVLSEDGFLYIFPVLKGIELLAATCLTNDGGKKILRERGEKLMPKLVKHVEFGQDKSKKALGAISSVSRSLSNEYLDRVFLKNIQKLIEDKNTGAIKNAETLNKSIKNFDVILAILPSIDLRDTKWEISLSFIKCFINDLPNIQKKVYRFLLTIMKKVHSTFLEEVLELLKNNTVVSTAAKYFRVLCFKELWKRLGYEDSSRESQFIINIGEVVQVFLPEVVISLKDTNRRTRKISNDFLVLMGSKMKDLGVLKDFVSMLVAGLAGSTSLMKSDALIAIGRIYEKFGASLDLSFITEVHNIVMLMFREKNKEVFLALLTYLKHFSRVINKETFSALAKDILSAVFLVDKESKELHRSKVKHLLEKFIKKLGAKVIEASVPAEHKKLIKHIVRTEKKLKKKKIEKRAQNRLNKKFLEEEILQEAKKNKSKSNKKKFTKDEVDSEDNEDSDAPRGGHQMRSRSGTSNNGMMPAEDSNNLLLKFDTEKERFHFTEHPVVKAKEKLKKEEELKGFKDVIFKDGKIIVQEEPEEQTGKKRRREDKFDLEDTIKEEKEKLKKTSWESKRDGFKPNATSVHVVKESGDMFKPKDTKTGGDIKLPGKPDPYAFIQLNPKALNKRHRAKAGKAFETVLVKKTSGSLKGLKEKKLKLK